MFYDEEIINIVLSIIHEDCLWLDCPYLISKETLRDMTNLCSIGIVSVLKYVKNDEVNRLTGFVLDKRALRIDGILDLAVRYVTMGNSYKVYYKNQEGSSSSTTVYVAYKMVKENTNYDLCDLLRWKLLDNLRLTKT